MFGPHSGGMPPTRNVPDPFAQLGPPSGGYGFRISSVIFGKIIGNISAAV